MNEMKTFVPVLLDRQECHGSGPRESSVASLGGLDVQDVIETLPPHVETDIDENDDAYLIAVKALERYFLPCSNVLYEIHIFRQLKQAEHNKTVDQFISQLIH